MEHNKFSRNRYQKLSDEDNKDFPAFSIYYLIIWFVDSPRVCSIKCNPSHNEYESILTQDVENNRKKDNCGIVRFSQCACKLFNAH